MDVGPNRIAPVAPTHFATRAAGVSQTASTAGGWKSRMVGALELAKVAGEEEIDEKELRRDDPLGNLVSRAFDSGVASQVLRPLPIG